VSLLLDLGVPPHIVRDIVGHSDIEVTMTIYAHAALDEKRKAPPLVTEYQSRPFNAEYVYLTVFFEDKVGGKPAFAEGVREHVASGIGRVEPVHLPSVLTLGEDLTPRPPCRDGFPGGDLAGAGVHPPTPFGVVSRVASRDPPAMHEVVQHAKVKVHADLVEHRFQPGVESCAILGHHQRGPDRPQTLGRLGRAARGEVMWLCGHPWPPLTPLEPTETARHTPRIDSSGR
jgi:hypothetical protein